MSGQDSDGTSKRDAADPGVTDDKLFDPRRPPARELEMSVPDGFTLAAVGDLVISRPLTQLETRDVDFAAALSVLRRADIAFGNLETTIFDLGGFTGHPATWDGDWTLSASPDVAPDLARMGFGLLSRANNHVMDWGPEGMRETTRHLARAGLAHAGAGEHRGLARAAGYAETPAGRVALVAFVTSFRPTSDALAPHGAAPGRPGISALNVKQTIVVPAEIMKSLVEIDAVRAKALDPARQAKGTGLHAPEKADRLSLFGKEFVAGDGFSYHHEPDPMDLAEILKSIRQGKAHADFLVASVHSHEYAADGFPELPGHFLRDVAHAAIDAGADAFVTSGIHHLGPVEIYRGRPVFYGLGNFFWSDIQEPLPGELYQRNMPALVEAFAHPERATDADFSALLNTRSFANELTFETLIAECRFAGGGLSEIRLHPVDLGYGRRLTESGIPRLAAPEKAPKILERVREASRQFGTPIDIAVEDGVGVIRAGAVG